MNAKLDAEDYNNRTGTRNITHRHKQGCAEKGRDQVSVHQKSHNVTESRMGMHGGEALAGGHKAL